MQKHGAFRGLKGLHKQPMYRLGRPKSYFCRRPACSAPFLASADGPFEDFARTAQRAGTQAWSKLNQAYVVVDDQVKRTASQVDNKYDVSGKAQQAANQVSEQAKYVDSRYGVKRRLRNFSDDVQRKWPIRISPARQAVWPGRASNFYTVQWKRRYAEFSKTLPGQVFFLSAVFFLFWSGIAWRLLNLVFIAWWLSPFIFLLYSKVFQWIIKTARELQCKKGSLPLKQEGLEWNRQKRMNNT